MNTKLSLYLLLVSGFLLIVGCGGGQSDWKDILRDGKVFSEVHLGRFEKQASEITSGEIEGVEFHLHAAGRKTVGIDATEVERLYGSPTRVVADEWGHLTHYYGEVGIDLDPKTKGVIGVVVPTKEVAVEFVQVLDTVLSPEQSKGAEGSGTAKGTIAQNETVMNVKDAFAVWGHDDNEDVLSVFFFPTLLSKGERALMASGEPFSDPFSVTANKEPPADLQLYPHIELEITYKPDEPRSSETVTNVFLAINKIEDTGTYSIPLVSSFGGNESPTAHEGHEKLETVFSGDGKLDMVFKGGTTARSKFAWDVELKDQPVVE